MGNSEQKLQFREGYGYRIIHLLPDSPSAKAGLEIFVDFIIDIDDPEIKKQNLKFNEIIQQQEEKPVKFKIFNIVTRRERQVVVTPSKNWPNADGLLGIMLRYEEYQNIDELTYRILEVFPNSPAEKAGFQKLDDYIIGIFQYKYQSQDEMIDYIIESQYSDNNQGLDAILYNSKTRKVRQVHVVPNLQWGGKGSLGCEFGNGVMNQIPNPEEQELNPDTYKSNLLTEAQIVAEKQDEAVDKNVISQLKSNQPSVSLVDNLNRKRNRKASQDQANPQLHRHFNEPFQNISVSDAHQSNEDKKAADDFLTRSAYEKQKVHSQEKPADSKAVQPFEANKLPQAQEEQKADPMTQSAIQLGTKNAAEEKKEAPAKDQAARLTQSQIIQSGSNQKAPEDPNDLSDENILKNVYESDDASGSNPQLIQKEAQQKQKAMEIQPMFILDQNQMHGQQQYSYQCPKLQQPYVIKTDQLFNLNISINSFKKQYW